MGIIATGGYALNAQAEHRYYIALVLTFADIA